MTDYSINFEDGVYVFEYRDDHGFVVTDGSSVEQLWINIRDAMKLHFEGVQHSKGVDISNERQFTMPITLSFSPASYAFDLQRD